MGGLFSSEPTPAPRRHQDDQVYLANYYRRVHSSSLYPESAVRNTRSSFSTPSPTYGGASPTRAPMSRESVYNSYREPVKTRRIEQQALLPLILETQDTANWTPMADNIRSMRYINLPETDDEFRAISTFFKRTTKSYFKVIQIERVQNPFLMAQYFLRKDEMDRVLRKPVEEELLFHGTKTENVDQICRENFNWRLHGHSIGNRFGRGISFSKISFYASHYSSKGRRAVKKMIVARVMIGQSCIGHAEMRVPLTGCDTSMKEGEKDVFVKYQDDEFYPAYVITYEAHAKRN